jgi:ADP-L-glycero-D-manno-heptose 6-epimerase
MTPHKDKMIVVTGGAGFIGSATLRYLNDQGYHNLLVVDRLGTSLKWQNLVGKRYQDIIHSSKLMDFLKNSSSKVSAIIHLGAISSTTEIDAHLLLENNYRYTIHLAQYAVENNIRFIYASSAATYGMGELGFKDCHHSLEHLRPLNMYGYSKHMVDLWLKHNHYLDKVVGLKYFNVFGPNEAHKGSMASVIYHFFSAAKEKQKIRLFASNDKERYQNGEQSRDFIYVKDAVKMTCAFLDNDKKGIYNIASGVSTTWNTLAKNVFEALDVKGQIEYFDMPEKLSKQYQNYTCAERSKLKNALGDLAQVTPFKEAVQEYVHDYLIKGVFY